MININLPPHKRVLENNVFDIPKRLKEYDPSFFIVINLNSEKFEVHSTDNLFDTYCFTVPYDELDSRTIDLVKKNDTKKFGAKELEREIDENNKKIEEQKKKNQKKWIEDVAKETHSAFKKDLDHESIGVF